MINQGDIFCSFSVNDLGAAKEFYGDKLGLDVVVFCREGCGNMLKIRLAHGGHILVYPKEDHVPATYTILNFGVTDIEKEVEELKERGIEFLQYDHTDEAGINRDEGPAVAWFKDPAGNFLSVIQEEALELTWGDEHASFLDSFVE